jgi:hypothetical protein
MFFQKKPPGQPLRPLEEDEQSFNSNLTSMKPPRSQRLQNPTNSCPFTVGGRIRIKPGAARTSYSQSVVYTVTTIDSSDSTLRARDSSGQEGNWARWRDCIAVDDIGWEWLKTTLSPDALDLLGAFDGLECLRLRDDLRAKLVLQIPNLRERVIEAMEPEFDADPGPGRESRSSADQQSTIP